MHHNALLASIDINEIKNERGVVPFCSSQMPGKTKIMSLEIAVNKMWAQTYSCLFTAIHSCITLGHSNEIGSLQMFLKQQKPIEFYFTFFKTYIRSGMKSKSTT